MAAVNAIVQNLPNGYAIIPADTYHGVRITSVCHY